MCVCVCACEQLLHGLIPLSVIPLSYDHQEPTLDFSLLKGNVAHGKSPLFEGALSMRARTPLAAAVPARRAPPPPPHHLSFISHTLTAGDESRLGKPLPRALTTASSSA